MILGLFKSPVLTLPDGSTVPVRFHANRRARKYIVRVGNSDDGVVVDLTMPRSGSKRFALDFATRHVAWIAKEIAKAGERSAPWTAGREILYRGERAVLAVAEGVVTWANRKARLPSSDADLRPVLVKALRAEAAQDLRERVRHWSGLLGLVPSRVAVRDQRTLWGSCSGRKTISLNWRLIMAPEWVADYLVVHELVHLAEMNHSRRFWDRVAAAFPRWREAEAWLAANRDALR